MLSEAILASLLASGALASPMQLFQRQSCPPVHVFGARETTASPGFGSAGAVVDSILSAVSGATSEAIDYPASGDSPPYAESVTTGVSAICSQVGAFAQQCPDTQLVVVGYSQGGEIFDDALCGGGSCSIADYNVKAAIFMGAPTYVAGLTYNVGSCAAQGFDAKPAGSTCGAFDSAVQSYCDAADPYCCTGSDANTHNQYATEYGADALAFVQSKLSSTGGTTTGGTTGGAVSSAPAAAATSAAVVAPSSAAFVGGASSVAAVASAAPSSGSVTPVMWGC